MKRIIPMAALALGLMPASGFAGGIVTDEQSAYVLAVNSGVCGPLGVASAYFDDSGELVAVCNGAPAAGSLPSGVLPWALIGLAAAAAFAASATD